MSMYDDHPVTNNKVIAQIKQNSITWPWTLPFKGQGQIQLKCLECVVTNIILSKYE